MRALTGFSRINFDAFPANFDFSKFKTFCDIEGATGLHWMKAAKKHPALKCASFDLPQTNE